MVKSNWKSKLFIGISLAMMVVFLFNCTNVTESGNNPGNTDGRVLGDIHGVVTESATNARLEGIKVKTVIGGKHVSTYTDSLGYYEFTEFSPGEYELTFADPDSVTSYAMGRTTAMIPTIKQLEDTVVSTDENYTPSKKTDMDMYKLNAGLTGKIYAKLNDEDTEPADGVKVVADFSDDDLSKSRYTTVTNSEGIFSFSDIPSTKNVDIMTMPYKTGQNEYSTFTRNNVTLEPEETLKTDMIVLPIAGDEPFITNNNFAESDFAVDGDIEVTFSKAMLTSSFDGDITLTGPNGDVEADQSWSNDLTLTVSPYAPLQTGTDYDLSLNGKSQDGHQIDTTLTVSTQDGIEFEYTNVERLDGNMEKFPADQAIEITFTKAVDLNNSNTSIDLINENGQSVAKSLSKSDSIVIITPEYDLKEGHDYTVDYNIYSTIPGDNVNKSFTFTTEQTVNKPGEITSFNLDHADDWKADYDTKNINFKWSTVENAEGYRIYAKDNENNSNYVEVADVGSKDFQNYETGSVDLSNNPDFDYYEDDNIQTPFAGGTEVTFKVVPYNDIGEGTESSTISVKDKTDPETTNLNQIGGADNNGKNTPDTIKIDWRVNEYLDNTQTLNWQLTSTDDGKQIAEKIQYEMDADNHGATFYIKIPADTSAETDKFSVSDYYDNSGNIQDDQSDLDLAPITP